MSDNKKSIFEFHTGAEIHDVGSNQAITDCPFCGKEKHFFFNKENYLWDCKVCFKSGNAIEFIRAYYDSLDTLTKGVEDIAAARGLPKSAVNLAKVKFNPANGSYLIPTFRSGKVSNLYKADRNYEGKLIIRASPTIGHTLMDWPDDTYDSIWVLEGHWDRIAFNCINKDPNAVAIGLPGAGTWKDDWNQLLDNKDVILCYDNDRPGVEGRNRLVLKHIANSPYKPKSIKYIKWPENYKDGYDLNDLYNEHGRGAWAQLKDFMTPYEPPKDIVVTKVDNQAIDANMEVDTFEKFVDVIKEVYHTTDAMVYGLLMVLSSIYSIKVEGEQIWVRMIGPPSSGKTSIAKAVSGSEQVVLKSTFTGLFSGFRDSGDNSDCSLVPIISNKTLIVKDADALLKQGNVEQIFSELRDFYDKESSVFYKNKVSLDYKNVRSTMVLCGTQVLRRSDSSFLGERFLDYELELSDDDREKIEFMMLEKSMKVAANPSSPPPDTPVIAAGKGFITHMMQRETVYQLDARTQNNILTWSRLASAMRTKVDREQYGAKDIRSTPVIEAPARLIGQMSKLYMCATTVLGLQKPDERVHRLLAKVAKDIMDMNSTRMKIIKYLIQHKEAQIDTLHKQTNVSIEKVKTELVDLFILKIITGYRDENGKPGRDPFYYTISERYVNDLADLLGT